MARIELKNTAHSYIANPKAPQDYALRRLDHVWEDGGAYALVGPSGCGKSTLLNIISGLLHPSEGQVLFDGKDVTQLPTKERNIAQVFQFPVTAKRMAPFLVADHSKIGRDAMARLGHMSQIDEWFTDQEPPAQLRELLTAAGATIHVCSQ